MSRLRCRAARHEKCVLAQALQDWLLCLAPWVSRIGNGFPSLLRIFRCAPITSSGRRRLAQIFPVPLVSADAKCTGRGSTFLDLNTLRPGEHHSHRSASLNPGVPFSKRRYNQRLPVRLHFAAHVLPVVADAHWLVGMSVVAERLLHED